MAVCLWAEFIDVTFVFLVQIFTAPTCAIWKVVPRPLQWQYCGELSGKNLAECGENLGVKIVCLTSSHPRHFWVRIGANDPQCEQKFNDY